jgi:hypothetical protein
MTVPLPQGEHILPRGMLLEFGCQSGSAARPLPYCFLFLLILFAYLGRSPEHCALEDSHWLTGRPGTPSDAQWHGDEEKLGALFFGTGSD